MTLNREPRLETPRKSSNDRTMGGTAKQFKTEMPSGAVKYTDVSAANNPPTEREMPNTSMGNGGARVATAGEKRERKRERRRFALESSSPGATSLGLGAKGDQVSKLQSYLGTFGYLRPRRHTGSAGRRRD